MVINSISFWEAAALFCMVAAEFCPPTSSEQMLQCPRVLNSTDCTLCKVHSSWWWLIGHLNFYWRNIYSSLCQFLIFCLILSVLWQFCIWWFDQIHAQSLPRLMLPFSTLDTSQIHAPFPTHLPFCPFVFGCAVGLSLECYCCTRAKFLEETYPSFPTIKQ